MNDQHLCTTTCGRPAPDSALCRTCLSFLLADLRTVCEQRTDAHGAPVLTLADELLITLMRGNRGSTGRVGSRSTTTPLPWHERAGDIVLRLRSVLGTWASRLHLLYSARLPDPTDPTGYFIPPPDFTADVESMAAWLTRHPSWMGNHPEAAILHREIIEVIADAWQVIDRAPDRWYAGPCEVDGCAGQVFGTPGGTVATCGVCRMRYDMVARRAFLFEAAREYVMTAAELSRAIPVLCGLTVERKTITTWAKRGWLVVREYDNQRGWPLYRVGDVQELIVKRATRSA